MMTLSEVKGSLVKFECPKNAPKSKEWAISRMLFHSQTSYLVSRYNPIGHLCDSHLGQGHRHRSRSNFSKTDKRLNNFAYLGFYFTDRLHTWYQGTTQ